MKRTPRLSADELKTIAGGAGVFIDPNGDPADDTGDNGCGIDPNG